MIGPMTGFSAGAFLTIFAYLCFALILFGGMAWIWKIKPDADSHPEEAFSSGNLEGRDRTLHAGVWVSLGLYVAACILPAYQIGDNGKQMPGWVCLIIPLFAPGAMLVYYYWYANPLYYYALVQYYCGQFAKGMQCCLVATALSAAFQLYTICYHWGVDFRTNWRDINPSGYWYPLHVGSWLWVGSFALSAFCMRSLAMRRKGLQSERPE